MVFSVFVKSSSRSQLRMFQLIVTFWVYSAITNAIVHAENDDDEIWKRGFLKNVPKTPSEAMDKLQKRNEEFKSHDRAIRSIYDAFNMINFDFMLGKKHGLKKRDIWQLPELIASRNISQTCITSFLIAIPALTDILFGEIPFWPLHLIDSTGKSAIGSLRGTRRKRGNLHECLWIKAKLPKVLESLMEPVKFSGKFCHIIAEYGNEEFTYHMENEVIPPKKSRRILDTEICFPSVCTDHDVNAIVTTFSSELIYDEFDITYMKCVVQDKGPLSSWTIFVIVICSVWGILLLIGSGFDLLQEFVHSRKRQNWLDPSKPIGQTVSSPPEHGRLGRILLAFSLPRNFGYLLDNPNEYPPDEVIPAVGGVRFFAFFWMQMSMIYLISVKLPWGNYAALLEDLRTTNFQWVINGRFATETTFCLSGFLASYVTLRTIGREGHFSFLRYYLRRYWRLAPSYIFVMMLASAFLWYCFDEGPEWITKYQYEDACKKYWWTGLLFINNFFSDAETCPPISWYYAVHMQLHLMAPFIIYILFNKPRIGVWITCFLAVTFACVPALMTASQSLPFFIGRLFYFEDNYQQYEDLILRMPYTHAPPFLIGMLFGYMLFQDGLKSKMNKMVALSISMLSVIIMLVIIYGFYPYIDGAEKMSTVLGLFYTTLTPSLWALSVGWIIYASAAGHAPAFDYCLSLNIFSNFNRLSYCCFLAQTLAINHFMLSRPDPLYYEPWMVILIINGSILMAIFGGISISAAIERPCLELEKALTYKSVEEQNSNIVTDFTDEEAEEEEEMSN